MNRIKLFLAIQCMFWGAQFVAAENFTTYQQTAQQFGVHEVVIKGIVNSTNPLDVQCRVTFEPPSGLKNAIEVEAFYDNEDQWRARVYVNQPGQWRWHSRSADAPELNDQSGQFTAASSQLPGRLLPHPKNSRHWITENGKPFLNISDTAYFLLCQADGNGEEVSDDIAARYIRDDVAKGITSIRCFLASRSSGFVESNEQWEAWFFVDGDHDRLALKQFQQADRRLRMLLNSYPEVAVQLILFPLGAYGKDDDFWKNLTPRQRERVLRQLVARYAAYPQIFWLIVNDAHYGDRFPNNNQMAREVGDYLLKHDPWHHPRSTGHARRLPFVLGGEPWVDYIHIEHAHDLNASQIEPYWQFNKPIFLGEDRYENDHGPKLDPAHMQYWQRRLFWSWLLSGGSTNYGGRWFTVQPYSETGILEARFHKRPDIVFNQQLVGLDSVAAIVSYFRERQIALADFEPDHDLAANAAALPAPRRPRVMRYRQSELIAYCANALADEQDAQVNPTDFATLDIDLSTMAGRFSIEWYRAKDGQSQFGPEVVGGAVVALRAPWRGTDVVVRLKTIQP